MLLLSSRVTLETVASAETAKLRTLLLTCRGHFLNGLLVARDKVQVA